MNGGWAWSQDFGEGEVDNLLVFQTKGNTFAGKYQREDKKYAIKDGKIKGNEFSFKLTTDFDGETIDITCNGKVDGDKMVGSSAKSVG